MDRIRIRTESKESLSRTASAESKESLYSIGSYEVQESKGNDGGDYASSMYAIGSTIERVIDGMWFAAEVVAVDEREREIRIRYIDDGKVETGVPLEEVRHLKRGPSDRPVQFAQSPSTIETLRKPLQGLIDDDSSERLAHKPTVVIHSCADSGSLRPSDFFKHTSCLGRT